MQPYQHFANLDLYHGKISNYNLSYYFHLLSLLVVLPMVPLYLSFLTAGYIRARVPHRLQIELIRMIEQSV